MKTYLINFWNYQTAIELIILFLSILSTVLCFYFSEYIFIFSLLLGFSVNYIVSVFHSFEKDRNILIERRGLLNYMMNIYHNPAIGGVKKIIDDIKNNLKVDYINPDGDIIIDNFDAFNLKEYLMKIKEDAIDLDKNKSLVWKERYCLRILIDRINDFIDNNENIPIIENHVAYFHKNITIKPTNLSDIQYYFESGKNTRYSSNDTTIEEMFNKYKFKNNIYS